MIQRRGQFGCLGPALLLLVSCHSDTRSNQPEKVSITSQPTPEVSNGSSRSATGDDSAATAASHTEITAHHVVFHESSGLHLRAEWLRGRLFATHPGGVASLDDPSSFRVEVITGTTFISMTDLSRALDEGVLKNSKLRNIKISAHGSQEIEIRAVLHRMIPLPVQLTGEIKPTADGRLEIHVKSVKVLKIPFKGLMHLARLDASDFIGVKDSHAVQFKGDEILLRTEALLPAPAKSGKLTAVHFARNGDLQEDYGTADARAKLFRRGHVQNFMSLEGGAVRFGKLTMTNADMTLIDSSPGDWFEFDLAHYRRQLVAGDMHMTSSGGLLVFTPDSTKIGLPGGHARVTAESQ